MKNRYSPARRGDIPHPPVHSGAWLNALVCPTLVDSRELLASLPKGQNLSLPRLGSVAKGLHPLIIEIWQVHDGRMEAAGIDAHGWAELAAATAGIGMGGAAGAVAGAGFGSVAGAAGGGILGLWLGPIGWWCGATAGAVAGATTGATLAATAGAMFGARWGAGSARRASEAGARVIGSYNEIMVTIPCARVGARDSGDFAFVPRMYSDSAISRWGEWILGFGYRKEAARVTRGNNGSLQVSTKEIEPILKLVVGDVRPKTRNAAGCSQAKNVLASLGRPLLGIGHSGRPVVSYLERFFDHGVVGFAPVSVRLQAAASFLPGLQARTLGIDPVGPDHPWGAFVATRLPVKLSYPRGVRQ